MNITESAICDDCLALIANDNIPTCADCIDLLQRFDSMALCIDLLRGLDA